MCLFVLLGFGGFLKCAERDVEEIFTNIYDRQYWGSIETVSGWGSRLFATANIRSSIPALIKKYNIKTLLDIPCGDFNWMKEVDLGVSLYIGADIVKKMININNEHYGSKDRIFMALDATVDDLPQVDMIFCRDCLIHLTFKEIHRVIQNFKKSGAKYLLVSNGLKVKINIDLEGLQRYRPINLLLFPFNFPRPKEILMENDSSYTNKHVGRCLMLWKLDDINI